MPRRRRAAHLRIWLALAAVLPAILVAALLHRAPADAPAALRLDAPEADR
jgi:hypothetical protein